MSQENRKKDATEQPAIDSANSHQEDSSLSMPRIVSAPVEGESGMRASVGSGGKAHLCSTGPRSIQGKRISSRNALVYGFFSRELVQMHLKTEDRRSYRKLFNTFVQELNPFGQLELIQIELMTNHLYQYLRLLRHMDAMRGDKNPCAATTFTIPSNHKGGWLDDLPSLEKLERYQRCESHILRSFYRAQAELERLQKIRLGEQVPPRLTVDINN
jgi:hypothetical protein